MRPFRWRRRWWLEPSCLPTFCIARRLTYRFHGVLIFDLISCWRSIYAHIADRYRTRYCLHLQIVVAAYNIEPLRSRRSHKFSRSWPPSVCQTPGFLEHLSEAWFAVLKGMRMVLTSLRRLWLKCLYETDQMIDYHIFICYNSYPCFAFRTDRIGYRLFVQCSAQANCHSRCRKQAIRLRP